jgi:hypothetical protein
VPGRTPVIFPTIKKSREVRRLAAIRSSIAKKFRHKRDVPSPQGHPLLRCFLAVSLRRRIKKLSFLFFSVFIFPFSKNVFQAIA